jgi:ketosteroid isomerase-like protein
MPHPEAQAILGILREINQAWLRRRPDELGAHIHPHIVMVFPSFSGSVRGREAFLAGFEDFCHNAQVLSFREWDHQADVTGETAVASFAFEMVYMREGRAYKAKGRDLWVFGREAGGWRAIWRTMPEMVEMPAEEEDLNGTR